MKRELVESYFDWNEIRLEAYLRIDPELIELERECEATILEPVLRGDGQEMWQGLDRIISAKNSMEGIVAKEMYIRGFLDYERLVCEIERDV